MTIEEEPRQQQSPSQSLTTLWREGLNPTQSSVPRLQHPIARMSRNEQQAHLASTIELGLAIMSGADAPVFVSPLLAFSASSENDEDSG